MLFLVLVILFVVSSPCNANISDFFHSQQDKIGVDKFAHAGAGYVISDQLKKHSNMNAFWRVMFVAGLAAVKEEIIDKGNWDRVDFYATVFGSVYYEVLGSGPTKEYKTPAQPASRPDPKTSNVPIIKVKF